MIEQNINNSEISSSEFTFEQLTDLSRLISQAIDNKMSNIRQTENSIFSDDFEAVNSRTDNHDQRYTKNWIVDEIDFFDSSTENTDSIVNVDKHVFYRDIYAFTDRLKNMTLFRDELKLRTIISQCLRESVLIWHSIELFELEKKMLREISLFM